MPVCPACKTQQAKRIDGRCPNCGTAVEMYKGYWYRASIGSPSKAVVTWFESQVSKTMSVGREVPVVFAIPRRGQRWRRELVSAERMLESAEGDYDLVIETLSVMFSDRKYSWRTYDSLIGLERPYIGALAIAKANRIEQEQHSAAIQRSMENLRLRENVFA